MAEMTTAEAVQIVQRRLDTLWENMESADYHGKAVNASDDLEGKALSHLLELISTGVWVPRDFAEWGHGLLRRRLTSCKGTWSWLQPWYETELGKRDERWANAIATALEAGNETKED